MMKFPDADAIGPPNVVVAVPVTANDEVVALVNSPFVKVPRVEKKL